MPVVQISERGLLRVVARRSARAASAAEPLDDSGPALARRGAVAVGRSRRADAADVEAADGSRILDEHFLRPLRRRGVRHACVESVRHFRNAAAARRLRAARRGMAAQIDPRHRRKRSAGVRPRVPARGRRRLFLRQAPTRAAPSAIALRPRDPARPRGSRTAIGQESARALRRRGRRARLRRGVHHERRRRPRRRIRRAVHPRNHRGESPHVPHRAPRRSGRSGRHRRFELDPEMHEQGVSGGTADAAQDRVPENAGRARRQHRRHRADARPARRA